MKTALSIVFASFSMLINLQSARDPDWRQIAPLSSTRSDVERLLGPTSEDFSADYELQEGHLFIVYSSGPCKRGGTGGWNVPKDVVVQMSFSPRLKKPVTALKLDPKRFRKVIGEHVRSVVYYINDEVGLTYEVQRGRVDAVSYEPGRKDRHLYCGDPKDLERR